MNSGKSTQLLQIAYNYREMGKTVLLFTAAIDDRAGQGAIKSRLGASSPAEIFSDATNFVEIVDSHPGISCLMIDEAQFLSEAHVRQLHQVAALKNIPVMCFGLRSDFQGVPFPGSAYLLTLAEDIQEVKAICSCGRKSTMNMRLDETGRRVTHGDQILIGGNSRYRQVCARCFYS